MIVEGYLVLTPVHAKFDHCNKLVFGKCSSSAPTCLIHDTYG